MQYEHYDAWNTQTRHKLTLDLLEATTWFLYAHPGKHMGIFEHARSVRQMRTRVSPVIVRCLHLRLETMAKQIARCESAGNWTFDLVGPLEQIIDPEQRVAVKTAQACLPPAIGFVPTAIVSSYAFALPPEGFEALYQACLEPERLFYSLFRKHCRPSESPAWPNQQRWRNEEVWEFHEGALQGAPHRSKRSSSPVEEEERPKKLIKSF